MGGRIMTGSVNCSDITVNKDIITEYSSSNTAITDGTKELEVSVNRREYNIVGDELYIPKRYEDAPQWLRDIIDTVTSTSISAALNDVSTLGDMLTGLIAELEVAKNTYTMSIISDNDINERINTAIETLNSTLADADSTVLNVAMTRVTPEEAQTIALGILSASIAGGDIAAAIQNLQSAIADVDSARALDYTRLTAQIGDGLENESTARATAVQYLNTYVGIDTDGVPTGLGTLDIILGNIQDQVDGSISTWFYDAEPTLTNLPASEWTTTETNNIHLGDIYYDRLTGFAYRFAFEDIDDTPDAGVIYTWIRITDSDVTKALAEAAQAQETADGKITTFYQSTQPTAEGIGDIWIDSDAGNKMYRWNGTTWGSDLVGTMVANAEAVTALEADLNDTNIVVGGHTAQLSTVDTRIADGVASVETKWAYNSIVNINGVYKKSGFGLTTNYTSGSGTEANPYVSEFWIDASRLKFTNSAMTGRTAPFTIDASGTTPQITFNGKVTFSNVTDVPSLGTSSNNLLTNSAPTLGNETYGWQVGWYNTNIVPNAVAAGSGSWRPTGAGSVCVQVGGAPTVGTVFDIKQYNNIPVVAGKRYEISALLSSHRCTSVCTLAFFNSAGTYISEIGAGTANSVAYSGDLSNWVRQGGFVTVPAGTSYAWFYIRSAVTGTNPYCFVAQAYMGEVPNDKTEFSSWGEGVSANSTTIDGGKITTGTITSDKISTYNLTAANATFANSIITNAMIANASIDAAKIIDGNITNAKIGYASVDTLKIQGEAIVVPRFAEAIGSNRATIYYTPTVTHTVLLICNVQWSTGEQYYVIGVNGAVHKNGIMGSYGSSTFTKAFSISTLVTLSAGVAYSLTFQLSGNGAYYNTAVSEWTQITMMGAKR